MKAVASLVCTGVLPTARTHSTAVLTAASSVRPVRTTSTSFMSGTGLKKWRPSTCPGRRVAAAIAVTLHDEVLEARIARGGQTRSSLANVSFLSGWFSVIASTTRSQSWRSSSRVVPPMRPSASSFAFASILPRATSASSVVLRLPRPRWSRSSLASTTVVAKPAWAETCAMPDPMSPQPSTPTLSMGIGPPGLREASGQLVAEAPARQRRRFVVRGPGRARVLHDHTDVAVAHTAICLNDAGRVTWRRAVFLQGLVEGSLAALDGGTDDAEEQRGADRRLGL